MRVKKFAALSVAAAMTFSMTQMSAFVLNTNAAGTVSIMENKGEASGEYEFDSLEDGTAKITKYKGSGGEIAIPSELAGKKVTAVKEGAFLGSSGVTKITIPSGITSIDGGAFSGCIGLTEVAVAADNPNFTANEGILYDKRKSELFLCPAKRTGSFKIPSTVKKIADEAFFGCSGLTEIKIFSGVISIGERAFYGCSGLNRIDIPNSVNHIGDGAFSYCVSLANISVAVDNINYSENDGVLFDKDGKKLITCPANRSGIYVMPSTVRTIGEKAFYGCKGLTSVTISENATTIEEGAFENCTGIVNMEIPNTVTSISHGAFDGCSSLTGISVKDENRNYAADGGVLFNLDYTKLVVCPGNKTGVYEIASSVKTIGEEAFYGCSNLTGVTIPASVSEIEEGAFKGCSGLASLEIPDSVSSIGDDAFERTTKLIVTKGSAAETYAKNNGYDHETKGGQEEPQQKAAPLALTLSFKSAPYTGKEIRPDVKAIDTNNKVIDKSNYDVVYTNNKNAGVAKVTVNFKNSYTGTLEANFTITKAANTVKVNNKAITKATTFSVKKSAVNKKAVTYKVSRNGSGSITMANKSASKIKKYLSFKGNKITLKKKAPKGSYKFTLTVSANGNWNKTTTKVVTIKVK